MSTRFPGNSSLLPITRLVLIVSAVVQLIFGLVMVLTPGLVNNFFWPAPFEPTPPLAIRYHGLLYLAMSLGAAYAFSQNSWLTARTYLVIAGPYVALCVVLALVAASGAGGAPLILWLYVILALLYLPIVAYAWWQESSGAVGAVRRPA